MKSIKLLLALLSISLFSCGPFEEVNMGYPESVIFSKEGGVETISVSIFSKTLHAYLACL